MRTVILILSFVLLSTGCNYNRKEVRRVDFSESDNTETPLYEGAERPPLKVAVSAILSPRETFSSYEEILSYIGNKLDLTVEFHQRRTYGEINNMLEKGQLDFAFICSGAYVEFKSENGPELLAAPVSHGKPYYQAYIIVPSGSQARSLTDLKGLSFAYTDLLSNTGYLYALYRIMNEGEDPGSFFSSTVFTHAHDVSIQMVAKGLVDGATIDGLVFDYLMAKEPGRVKDIRIIEISEYFGIPPVVASGRMDRETRDRVRDVLFGMHLDENGRDMINSLLIDKFIEGKDEDYDGIRKMRAAVGY